MYLNINHKIIKPYENNVIPHVLEIKLNKNYMMHELFNICDTQKKDEIINCVENMLEENKIKLDHIHNKISKNFCKLNYDSFDDDNEYLIYIYNILFLKDNNLFYQNKHILYLLRNQYKNFNNYIYPLIFFNIINKKYNLKYFFQNNFIRNNIFLPYNINDTNYLSNLSENFIVNVRKALRTIFYYLNYNNKINDQNVMMLKYFVQCALNNHEIKIEEDEKEDEKEKEKKKGNEREQTNYNTNEHSIINTKEILHISNYNNISTLVDGNDNIKNTKKKEKRFISRLFL